MSHYYYYYYNLSALYRTVLQVTNQHESYRTLCRHDVDTLFVTNWLFYHDDVIKWQHLTRFWPFMRGIHRSPVKSPHKGQWRGPLMFSLICAWINGRVNNPDAGDLRRHHALYEVTVRMREIRRSPLDSPHELPVMRSFDVLVAVFWTKHPS